MRVFFVLATVTLFWALTINAFGAGTSDAAQRSVAVISMVLWVVFVLGLGYVVLSLAIRFVKAVEKIAEQLKRAVDVIEPKENTGSTGNE